MEFINADEKLKSSPVPILFIPFDQNEDFCFDCGIKYSETLLFKQKYCIKCLLKYVSKMVCRINRYEMTSLMQNIHEWGKDSFFKQVPTNSLAYYDDDNVSIEEQNRITEILENEKGCKLCGK